MPFTPQTKTPRGFERTGVFFKEVSEGDSAHEELKPWQALPVLSEDKHLETFRVIEAGVHVSHLRTVVDNTGTAIAAAAAPGLGARRLVPNNGLSAAIALNAGTFGPAASSAAAMLTVGGTPVVTRRLAYTADDVGRTPDPNGPASFVASIDADGNPGTGAAYMVPAAPVGYAAFTMFEGDLEQKFLNLSFQSHVTVNSNYMYEIPLRNFNKRDSVDAVSVALGITVVGANPNEATYGGAVLKTAAAVLNDKVWEAGDLLCTDHLGRLILWTEGVDDVAQIVGRVWSKRTIGFGLNSRTRMDLVKTVPGTGLAGSETKGIPQHLYAAFDPAAAFDFSTNRSTEVARVNSVLLS